MLAESGYVPKDGPVEFHWYAAEEGGLLGSQAVARWKKESGVRIGAMMEFVSVSVRFLTSYNPEMVWRGWGISLVLTGRKGYDSLHRTQRHRVHRFHLDFSRRSSHRMVVEAREGIHIDPSWHLRAVSVSHILICLHSPISAS